MQKKCIQLTLQKKYKIQKIQVCIITVQIVIDLFGTEIIKLKAKDSEILAYSLCLGNISKDWSHDNIKKTGLKGYV